ncbi:ABC transporter substrate-binding protein [Aureimonas leprariae]|nr:ABC transporter substrate-binding protein [Aureimonas leprariae]
MDYALTEILFSLDVPVAGLAEREGWQEWVVEPALPAEIVDVGLPQAPNLELISELRPDLILTTPWLDPVLSSLQRVAPTLRVSIYEEGATPFARSYDATRLLGERLGRPDRAARFIAEADREFDAIAARMRRLAPPPLLLVNFVDARHVRVYGGDGLYQSVLDRIGLKNAFQGEANYWGFATVGVENLAASPGARLIAFEPIPPDALPTLARSPIWRELPFVRDGRMSTLPPVLTFGAMLSSLRCARLLADELERVAT